MPIIITFCQECDTGLWQFKNVSQCCVAFMINYSIAFVEKNLSVSGFGKIIEFLETTRWEGPSNLKYLLISTKWDLIPLWNKREKALWKKKLDDGNETAAASRRVEWSKNPNENDDLFSRTKIYQKVFVGTHFLILIFDFKLKGLSKMTDRFCEGKKFHHQQQQQQQQYHYWYLICWSNKTENPFNQKREEDQAFFRLC